MVPNDNLSKVKLGFLISDSNIYGIGSASSIQVIDDNREISGE